LTFNVSRVRAAYPALGTGNAYLDGAAGTQVPTAVIDAVAAAYREGISNTDGAFAASERSTNIVAECRAAVADLVGGVPSGVVFGPSTTELIYRLSAALSRRWVPGDSIVLSRLDHDANIRPWVQAADRAGVAVRWAEVDVATGELHDLNCRSCLGLGALGGCREQCGSIERLAMRPIAGWPNVATLLYGRSRTHGRVHFK